MRPRKLGERVNWQDDGNPGQRARPWSTARRLTDSRLDAADRSERLDVTQEPELLPQHPSTHPARRPDGSGYLRRRRRSRLESPAAAGRPSRLLFSLAAEAGAHANSTWPVRLCSSPARDLYRPYRAQETTTWGRPASMAASTVDRPSPEFLTPAATACTGRSVAMRSAGGVDAARSSTVVLASCSHLGHPTDISMSAIARRLATQWGWSWRSTLSMRVAGVGVLDGRLQSLGHRGRRSPAERTAPVVADLHEAARRRFGLQ